MDGLDGDALPDATAYGFGDRRMDLATGRRLPVRLCAHTALWEPVMEEDGRSTPTLDTTE